MWLLKQTNLNGIADFLPKINETGRKRIPFAV